MAGMASAQLLIMALALGANKLPSGASGPLESVVERAAPEKCLFYYSTTPVAKANANSTNHAEIILADEGVQGFLSELKTQLASGIRQAGEINPGFAMLEQVNALSLVEIALTRPAAAYVERLTLSKNAPPDMVAGLVFNCGDRLDEVQKSVAEIVQIANRLGRVEMEDVKVSGAKLRRITEGETIIDFGFRDTLFFVTVGKEASADLLTRLDRSGAAPDWLTALRAKAKIERVSNVFYFSGSAAREAVEPLLTEPKARTFLTALGVDQFVSFGGVAGLADDGIVSRQFLDLGGWPSAWPETQPLTADDLKPIPDNTEFGTAFRFDVPWLYHHLVDILDPLVETKDENEDDDAEKKEHQLKERIAEAEEKIGFKIEDDLLASLGDVWTIHSMASGAIPASGLVVTLTIRDEKKLMEVHDKILAKATEALEKRDDAPFTIETKEVRGIKTYHLQPRGPIALDPAWGIVDGRLVITATYQGLKAHIARDGKKSLGKLPAVAARLQSGPIAISYQNTFSTLQQTITALQTLGPLVIGQLSQVGIHIEMPTLPDLEPLEPHILPRIEYHPPHEKRPGKRIVLDRAVCLSRRRSGSRHGASGHASSRRAARASGMAIASVARKDARRRSQASSLRRRMRKLSGPIEFAALALPRFEPAPRGGLSTR